MIPSFTKALERKELRTVENLVLEFRITLVKVGDLVGKPLPLRFLPERIIFMIGIVRSIDQAKIDSSLNNYQKVNVCYKEGSLHSQMCWHQFRGHLA